MSRTDTDTPVDESGLVDITPPKPGKGHTSTFANPSEDFVPPQRCKEYEALSSAQEGKNLRGTKDDIRGHFKW